MVLHAFQLRLSSAANPPEAQQGGQGVPSDSWQTDQRYATGVPGPSGWGPQEGSWVVVPAGKEGTPWAHRRQRLGGQRRGQHQQLLQ